MSAPAPELPAGRYDPGLRRRSLRTARERGCWLYVPAEELVRAGVDLFGPPPLYRVWGCPRGSVLVRLYDRPDDDDDGDAETPEKLLSLPGAPDPLQARADELARADAAEDAGRWVACAACGAEISRTATRCRICGTGA